jgi:hypothetical protein
MVKQSNIENKIDIVSILVEGTFNLPDQMLTSSGKNVIKGTLQSLKLFEKILKQTDYVDKQILEQQNKKLKKSSENVYKKSQTDVQARNLNKTLIPDVMKHDPLAQSIIKSNNQLKEQRAMCPN